jgi:hypothetical protein
MALSGILLLCASIPASEPGHSYEFRNGLWFDGQRFHSKTLYSENGLLRKAPPGRIDEVIDLAGKFVIPPLGEGHTHWLEPRRTADYINSYLREGVYYVKDHCNSPLLVSQFRDKVNLPTSLDFVSALQGFTAPGGHPLKVVEQGRQIGLFPPGLDPKEIDGELAMVVKSVEDVAKRWPLLMKGKPAFVKVFLVHSEDFDKRKDNPRYVYKRGLDPALLPEIVRRSHEAGLRVSAHVESAGDCHNALATGVDDIAHLPGIGFDRVLGKERHLITDADARLAVQRGTTVVTTLRWLEKDFATKPDQYEQLRKDVIIPNLRKLKKHGVRILVGSDQFRETLIPEIQFLANLGVFTNLEILRMACVDTPQAIFPNRRLGKLQDGYEASFLALERNPLEDLNHLKTVQLRFKQGVKISIPAGD